MSYKFRTFGCSGDDEVPPHDFQLMVDDGEYPRFCPKCGAQFEGEPEIIPGGGHIGGSAITRSVDSMYREVERGSAERAELAGSPALKVTNMRDHLREGDVAVPMPNNPVSQFMAQSGMSYGFGGGAMPGMTLATSTPTPLPSNAITGPGHEALWAIQGDQSGSTNQQLRQQMTQAGQIKDNA